MLVQRRHSSSFTNNNWRENCVRAFVFRAFDILNRYNQSVYMEQAQNPDSQTHVKKYNRTSRTNLSSKLLWYICFGAPCMVAKVQWNYLLEIILKESFHFDIRILRPKFILVSGNFCAAICWKYFWPYVENMRISQTFTSTPRLEIFIQLKISIVVEHLVFFYY